MRVMNNVQTYEALRDGGVQSTRRPTFAIASGVLMLIGFIQLVMLGLALVDRVGETRVVEKMEVERVYIPTFADESPKADKVEPRSYEDLLEKYGQGGSLGDYKLPDVTKKSQQKFSPGFGIRPSEQFDNSRFPQIRNSRVEKLVEDAKEAHSSGDVVRAIVMLEEAEGIDADEPAVLYRRALIFEDMRNWERASDQYDRLFALGPETGDYYDIATDKIANGVKEAPDVVPFQLGKVIQRVGDDNLSAELKIPVTRQSKREIEPSQINVRIFFYDIVDNKEIEPVPLQRELNIQKRWVTEPTNWETTDEEVVEAIYTLPILERSDVHLFGERRYFGHVVELYYKGELMDQVAYPGRLHGIHAKDQYEQTFDPNSLPFGVLPELQGLDSDGMLLPTIDE